jgi:dihydrofolate reductase
MKPTLGISMIVAMSPRRVIGSQGKLPWHIPEDLKRFRIKTMGFPILMGRKTFESIGRALPGRENWVLSRQPFEHPGVRDARSLDQALDQIQKEGRYREVFIIGGSQVYTQAMPMCQRILVTLVQQEVEGDVFFPEINPREFFESAREETVSPSTGLSLVFSVYDRVGA